MSRTSLPLRVGAVVAALAALVLLPLSAGRAQPASQAARPVGLVAVAPAVDRMDITAVEPACPWLVLLGRGRGDAEVDPSPYVARSHGREVTFQKNIKEWDQVRTEIARLARQVAAEVEERPVSRAVVKVRYAPFVTVTHGAPFPAPGNAALDPAGFEAAALTALAQFTPGRPVRLLGVRAEFAKDPADE